MSVSENRFHELSAGWALGALAEDEVRELREMLAAEPERVGELRALEEAALHLPLVPEPEDPPPRVRESLLEAVRSGGRHERPHGGLDRLAHWLRLDRPRVALAATAALLALAAGLVLHTARLQRTVGAARRAVVDLSSSLAERDRVLEVLESAEVELVSLDGLDEHPAARGRILWDPENRLALLQVSGLPPLPPGETYQFWVFPKEGVPASAAVFAVDRAADEAIFRLDGFPAGARQALRGFLVTREPEGGAAEPSERWYLGARLAE